MYSSMSATATGVLTTMQVSVALIQWSGNGTLGDTLVIEDNSNRIIWQAEAPAANYDMSLSFARPAAINGLNITTLGSGKVIVNYV